MFSFTKKDRKLLLIGFSKITQKEANNIVP